MILFSKISFDETMLYAQAKNEGELVGRNRKLWEEGWLPKRPTDIMIGDLVFPLRPYWMRGKGQVINVSDFGLVEIEFVSCDVPWGRASAITCYEHWKRLVIVDRY